MDKKHRKYELCKNVFNMLFVAWLGSIGYVFINFESLNNAKIIINLASIFLIAIILLILAKVYISMED